MTDMQAARVDRTALGILAIIASVLTMAFADAMVKRVSADLTLWQIFAARSLVALPLLLLLLRLVRISPRPRFPAWAVLRSVLLVLSWISFYAALPVLSLSVAAVAVYTSPIMIALLSAALLRQPVTLSQWGGVTLGFLGVLAILRPGTEAFSWFTLLPLAAAFFYALAMILTRGKCQSEAPLALAAALHATFIVTGLLATAVLALAGLGAETEAAYPFLLGGWAPMGLREWAVMALLGLLAAAYFTGVACAYQIAPPPVIATFDYAYLVSAALWGFVFFAETPDLFTVAGMILITLAGFLVAAPFSRKGPAALTRALMSSPKD